MAIRERIILMSNFKDYLTNHLKTIDDDISDLADTLLEGIQAKETAHKQYWLEQALEKLVGTNEFNWHYRNKKWEKGISP